MIIYGVALICPLADAITLEDLLEGVETTCARA